jgi:predicted DNA-binding ribbon-helix-helix protein
MGIDMSMGYRPRQNSGVAAAGYSKAKLTLLALATADSALARPRKNGVTNQLGWLPRGAAKNSDASMELMASKVLKRSIVLRGHKTSISIEDEFWAGLKHIAEERGMTLSALVNKIDDRREYGNLSSAIRVHVLTYYRDLCGAAPRGTAPPAQHAN